MNCWLAGKDAGKDGDHCHPEQTDHRAGQRQQLRSLNDVLETLRRSGAPYELTPGELGTSTMVSSGAVTKRVDRLAAAGLVSRRVSDHDARGRVVKLTAKDRSLIDKAFTEHIANEHHLVALLAATERTQLATLLEKWGRAMDPAD